MTWLPVTFVALYLVWHIYTDRTRVEASREYAKIDYSAKSRRSRS